MSSIPKPVVVYPNSMTAEPSSHSKGYFGPVFIVLSVIIVLAMIACCLGKLCSRRVAHHKTQRDGARHVGRGDIEDGFEKSMPTAKPEVGGMKEEARWFGNGEAKLAANGKKEGGGAKPAGYGEAM
ncbi:hypothetical protein ACLOJK_032496 [Asimina triloba]